jgi:hypothetical protein
MPQFAQQLAHSMVRLVILFGILIPALPAQAAKQAEPIHHELSITLSPVAGSMTVTDRITLPEDIKTNAQGQVGFVLNARLPIDEASADKPVYQGLLPITPKDPIARNQYLVTVPENRVVTISYSGTVSRFGSNPDAGVISIDGAALSGLSHWYPQVGERMVIFTLHVTGPKAWRAISQGARIAAQVTDYQATVTWQNTRPQDEIHLVAGPLTEYNLPGSSPVAQVFLRTPDQELADRYLTATARYIALYEDMLGPYPYSKFALVENFWETGYGMPSFTLLGSSVIRLPFIVDTSYPHEILHNWWGNGVFVKGGNWSEGLTAYLADHYLKERDGKGKTYRRDALVNYWDFVNTDKDFPLVEFTARDDRASQAVGYGKGMMLFHMLRKQLGDDDFFAGLRDFYLTHRFTHADYTDIAWALKRASGRDVRAIFQQWTRRLGAPDLSLSKLSHQVTEKGHRLTFTVTQAPGSSPYILYLPIRVTMEGVNKPLDRTFKMSRKAQTFRLDLPSKPTNVALDPDFDLFRTLATGEVPPALSGLYGGNLLYILPASAPKPMINAYRALAIAWEASDAQIVMDADLSALPAGRAVWVIGWENRFAPQAGAAMANQGAGALLLDSGIVLKDDSYARNGHGVALSTLDAERDNAALGWLAASSPDQAAALTRKLPHYGKYGYTVFAGDQANNVLKGGWPSGTSPLSISLGDK